MGKSKYRPSLRAKAARLLSAIRDVHGMESETFEALVDGVQNEMEDLRHEVRIELHREIEHMAESPAKTDLYQSGRLQGLREAAAAQCPWCRRVGGPTLGVPLHEEAWMHTNVRTTDNEAEVPHWEQCRVPHIQDLIAKTGERL